MEELKHRIIAPAASATPETLSRVGSEIEFRLNICRVTKGAHVEIY
jgi:hypothetical protein